MSWRGVVTCGGCRQTALPLCCMPLPLQRRHAGGHAPGAAVRLPDDVPRLHRLPVLLQPPQLHCRVHPRKHGVRHPGPGQHAGRLGQECGGGLRALGDPAAGGMGAGGMGARRHVERGDRELWPRVLQKQLQLAKGSTHTGTVVAAEGKRAHVELVLMSPKSPASSCSVASIAAYTS